MPGFCQMKGGAAMRRTTACFSSILLLAIACVFAFLLRTVIVPGSPCTPPPPVNPPISSGDGGGARPAWREKAERILTEARWTPEARDQVLALNAGWLEALASEAPGLLEEQLRCLKRLGTWPRVVDFVKGFPECAGLLATADNPEELVNLLDTDGARRELLLGLFVRHVGRRDIAALAAGLRGNRDLVCRLLERGLVGAEGLFIFPRTGMGSTEYENWLQDNLAAKLSGSDEELAAFVQFVLWDGCELLEQLDKDESFRNCFRSELWPKLVRVVDRQDEALQFYLEDAHLWPLLMLAQGEELLERRGLLAVPLLFGDDAYPADFRDQIITILLSGDGETFRALTEGRFRKEGAFRRLLRRPLPGPVLAAALNKLHAAGESYGPLLVKYDRLSNDLLAEEVGPPPDGVQTWLPFYTHYMIARKLWQGRDPTTAEYVEAGIDTAVDVASLLFPPAKGGKLATQTIRRAGTAALKKEVVELGVKAAGKKLSQKVTQQLAKQPE